jgi:glyoxylase I family protein
VNEPSGPTLAAIHHLALTVTDLEASIAWYESVLGFQRANDVPHYDPRSHGYGVMLLHPAAGLPIVLHHHATNDNAPFTEWRTGLDHVGLSVPTRSELTQWQERFTQMGVTQSPIVDLDEYGVCVLVFRDPDDIQLELVSPIR